MISGIVGTSLKYHFLVITLAVILVIVGVNQLSNMPVDVLPEFSQPYVEIQTEALGLSAEEVEQLITVPMEQDLFNGLPWVETMLSDSTPGLSSIVLIFEPGTDIYRARQMVTERLAQAFALPHVSKTPTMIQPLSSASRFMIIGLSSEDLSLIDMSIQARWTIAPRLLGVPGVANVAIWGNRDRQLQVQVDPARLRAQDVTLLQVLETTGNALWVSSLSFVEASTPGTGGFIDTPLQRLGIRHLSPILSAEDLAQVPVEGVTGLRLSDVANVVEDHQPLIGDAIVNDESNLLIVVEKFPGTNTLEVTRGVKEALTALQPGMPGIKFDTTLYRPATFIEMAISNLSRTLVIAAVLVVLALGLLLYGWRNALISLVAILVSLVTALYVLYLRGATLNSMVLTGLAIALGIVIDDAIVDVERIIQRLRQHRQEGSDKPIAMIIFEASLEVRNPIFFGTLVVLLILLLFFFIGGLTGSFFQPLALSFVLAVLASMFVALIVTPALSVIFLSNEQLQHRESPLITSLQRVYDRVINHVLQAPRQVYFSVGILAVIGLIVLPLFRENQLVPSFQEPYVTIQVEGAPGASRPEMDRIISRMSSELRTIPGVTNVGAHVGRAVFGDQVVPINSAELWVSVDPEADYDKAVTAIRGTVTGYPGFQHKVQTYLEQASSDILAKSNDTLVVRVYGQDYDVLRNQAEQVKLALAGIDGIVDSRVILPIEESTLDIKVDIAKAQQYGIKPGDVRRAAAILLSGLQVGSLFEEQKVFDVVVWSTPETRNSLTDIRDLMIDTPGGGRVRLGDVADVSIRPIPNIIKHEAVSRYLDVDATVSGRSLESVASDIKQSIQGVDFPLEYHAEVLGKFAEQRASRERTLAVVVVALIGIYLLLQASFANWRLATITFFTLPVTVVGSLWVAFLVGRGAITLGALGGLLTVLGIATRNAILLIAHYQHLRDQEGEAFGSELIIRGSRERVAPTVMTALTTGLALLPFVIFGNVPGLEILRPMTFVILGGLLTSTLFNLYILPALYLRFGASHEPDLGFQGAPGTDLPAVATD